MRRMRLRLQRALQPFSTYLPDPPIKVKHTHVAELVPKITPNKNGNGPDPGTLEIGGPCSSSIVWTRRGAGKVITVPPRLPRYLKWLASRLCHANCGKLTVDQFLLERADILSKPKKTQDRRGELRPLDTSYLHIGSTDKKKSKSKQIDQATSIHASHLEDDFPRIGAHVATPLCHLGPGMKDEELFVPPPEDDHVYRREQRRRGCECYGVSQTTHYYVRSSCQNVEDPDTVCENDITWLTPSYRTATIENGSTSKKRTADDDIGSEDQAGPSNGPGRSEMKKAKQV